MGQPEIRLPTVNVELFVECFNVALVLRVGYTELIISELLFLPEAVWFVLYAQLWKQLDLSLCLQIWGNVYFFADLQVSATGQR
jgi:hypothetical protein